MIFHDLTGMRESHIEMRIIVGPHAVLLAPPREETGTDVILEERAIDMLVEDFAWLALDRHRAVATKPIEVVVPLLQHEGQPANLAFGQQQAQFGMAIERPGENEIE